MTLVKIVLLPFKYSSFQLLMVLGFGWVFSNSLVRFELPNYVVEEVFG